MRQANVLAIGHFQHIWCKLVKVEPQSWQIVLQGRLCTFNCMQCLHHLQSVHSALGSHFVQENGEKICTVLNFMTTKISAAFCNGFVFLAMANGHHTLLYYVIGNRNKKLSTAPRRHSMLDQTTVNTITQFELWVMCPKSGSTCIGKSLVAARLSSFLETHQNRQAFTLVASKQVGWQTNLTREIRALSANLATCAVLDAPWVFFSP